MPQGGEIVRLRMFHEVFNAELKAVKFREGEKRDGRKWNGTMRAVAQATQEGGIPVYVSREREREVWRSHDNSRWDARARNAAERRMGNARARNGEIKTGKLELRKFRGAFHEIVRSSRASQPRRTMSR